MIAGEGRERVAALLLLDVAACRAVAQNGDTALTLADLAADPAVEAALLAILRRFSEERPGSSTALSTAIVLVDPPSIDAQEITDKGALNQRAVLKRRAALVGQLYGEPGGARVLSAT